MKELKSLQNKYKLSVRSFNICNDNGLDTADKIIAFYKREKSFLSLDKCGRKSELELTELYINLHQLKGYKSPKVHNQTKHVYAFIKAPTINQVLLEYVKKESSKLDTRSQNIINDILKSNGYSVFQLVRYFESINYEYSSIKYIGKKSAQNISVFYKSMEIYMKSLQNLEIEQVGFQIVKSKILEVIERGDEIDKYLEEKYLQWVDHQFPFFDFLEKLIKDGFLFEQRFTILILGRALYTRNKKKTYDTLSNKLGLTTERIRQLCVLDKLAIPFWNKINELLECIGIERIKKISFEQRDIIAIDEDEAGSFFTIGFYHKFLSLFIIPEYQGIHSAKELSPNYLLHQELSKVIDYSQFVDELKILFNKKRSEGIEINVNGFASIYLLKKLENINGELSERAFGVLEEIVFQEFEMYPSEGVINIKKNSKKGIYEYIIDVLDIEDKPLHIDIILIKLNEQFENFKSSKASVRSQLIKNPNFMYTGPSTYGLKKWESRGILGGMIKDLAEKYLSKFEKPKHIQEINDFIIPHRPTNKNNISTNLQIDPHNRFIHFGSGFFGLTSKRYNKKDTKFNKISNTSSRFIKRDYFIGSKCKYDWDTFIKRFSKVNGVFEIQIVSLLQDKIEQGKLKLLNDYLYITDNNDN